MSEQQPDASAPPTPPASSTPEPGTSPTLPEDIATLAITTKASNPLRNGLTGRISVYATFSLVGLFGLFLILDTIQFAVTGHESGTFTALTRGVGGLGLGSLLVTLGKSYFTRSG